MSTAFLGNVIYTENTENSENTEKFVYLPAKEKQEENELNSFSRCSQCLQCSRCIKNLYNLQLTHIFQQVHYLVRISIFVIIPAEDLHHFTFGISYQGIKNGGKAITNNVYRHNWLFRIH